MAQASGWHVDDLLPGYAAGATDPAERARVEAHVAACPRCQGLLADYEEAVQSLAVLQPLAYPPLRVHAALLRALPRARRGPPRWIADVVGRAAVLLAVPALVMGVALVGLWREMRETQTAMVRLEEATRQARLVAYMVASPDTAVRALEAAREGDRGYGMLMGPASGQFALLVAGGLEDPGAGRVYQVWLGAEGYPMSGGTFTVDPFGWGQARLERTMPVGEVRRIGVTVEPAGGSPAPTTDPVLLWTRP